MGRQKGAAIENQGGSAASLCVGLPVMLIVVVNSCADLPEFGVPEKLFIVNEVFRIPCDSDIKCLLNLNHI